VVGGRGNQSKKKTTRKCNKNHGITRREIQSQGWGKRGQEPADHYHEKEGCFGDEKTTAREIGPPLVEKNKGQKKKVLGGSLPKKGIKRKEETLNDL